MYAYTDLLIGLPGQTIKSHIESLKMAYDVGFFETATSEIRLLKGSRMEEDDYRKEHGIIEYFRLIPSAYGEYGGIKVMEFERIIRGTNTMAYKDFNEGLISSAY